MAERSGARNYNKNKMDDEENICATIMPKESHDKIMTSSSGNPQQRNKQSEINPLKRSSPTLSPPFKNRSTVTLPLQPYSPGGRQIFVTTNGSYQPPNAHPSATGMVPPLFHSSLMLPIASSPRPRSQSHSGHINSYTSMPPPPVSPMTTLSLPDLALPPNRRAVDNALAQERSRIKELEKMESKETITMEQLRMALKKERSHSLRLAGELAALRSSQVQSQAEAEIFEEGRINSLMRRLDDLQKEKGRIIVELEREEEMLTNSLQKKLNEVRREKAMLENQLEQEHLESKKKILTFPSTQTTRSGATSVQE